MKHFLSLIFATGPLFAQLPPAASDPVPAPQQPPILQIQPAPAQRPQFVLPDQVQPNAQIIPNLRVQGVSASFDPGARVGRPVKYRVTLMGATRITDLPQVPEVEGLTFRPLGRSMQGGGVTIFMFDVIANRPGSFVVPSFEFTTGGNKIVVPLTRLEVADAQPGEARYQPVLSYIDLPKRDFYVGETISGRIVFVETPDESPTYIQHVVKTGGSVVFRVDNMHRNVEVEIDGVKRRAVAKPVQITALKEGPTEVNCQVIVHIQKRDSGAQFQQPGGFAMQTQSTIDVPSTRFQVLPLPKEGRLPGFSGAIGQFLLGAPKISGTEVEVGEPITMAISLTGEGNLSGVSAPDVPADSPDWQIFKPTTDLDAPNDEATPLLATKTFTFTLIPKRPGVRATPALPYSYFDPVVAKFVDVSVPPQPVKVKAGAENPAIASTKPEERAPEVAEPKSAKPIEPSLTGLAESPGMWTRSLGPALWSRWFLAAQALPIVLLAALWARRARREHLAANPQILRRRHARAAARVALGEARAAARRGDQNAFLSASTRAIREAAAPLDTAQAGSLTQEEVLHILRDDEVASRTAKSIFESAEAHRYGANGTLKPDKLIPDLEHTLARLSAKA